METEVKKINPNAKVTAVSNDYDLNKDVTAMETFIAAGTDIIFLDAADSEAIAPSVKKALDARCARRRRRRRCQGRAGQPDRGQHGGRSDRMRVPRREARQEGNVVIIDSVPMVAIAQRVDGCKAALSAFPDITILSADQAWRRLARLRAEGDANAADALSRRQRRFLHQ
jgi:ribose transport system substrate-binding protein